jgi:O-antigen/teichoic acid export membrane protein
MAAFVSAGYGLVVMRLRMISCAGPRIGPSEIIASATPFGLATTAQALMVNLPVVLLTFLVDSKNVGYFVVAMVVSGAHSILGSAIGRMLFAKLCASNEDARIWLGAVFRQSLVLYVLLAMMLAVLLPYLVPIVYGDEFRYSGILAIGLVVSTSINALESLLEEALRAKGHARPILRAQIAGSASLCLLAVLFVPGGGLNGMVWACILSAIVQLIVISRSVARELRIAKRELILVTRNDAHALVSRLRSALIRI